MNKAYYIAAGLVAIYAAFYLRKAKAGKKAVAVVGDSLSLSNGGWQNILAKRYGWNIDNFSKVGQTSSAALARFKASSNRYDTVFIFLGANDAYSGVNPSFTIDNLKQIIEIAQSKGAKTIVIPGILSEKVSRDPKALQYDDLKSKMIYLPGMVVPILRTVDPKDVSDGIHFGYTTHKQLADLIDSWSLR
jgi:GDSL-like Lipase/Acylhydrolase family